MLLILILDANAEVEGALLTEDGLEIITEDGENIITEDTE
jgi:hypothetical protein